MDLSEYMSRYCDAAKAHMLIEVLEGMCDRVPEDVKNLIITLVRNGCPVNTLIKTLLELGEKNDDKRTA